MARTALVAVDKLIVDLQNFRTVPQANELDAVKAMISISPDYFWGLMESLIDDGYLPTESILVIEDSTGNSHVKEGNRRVASMKIILGQISGKLVQLPEKLAERILTIPPEWIAENTSIPCTIYPESDSDIVDRIVTRTHGKGSKAGRDDWETVARARHNRDKLGASEASLDLLEKYLKIGSNLTNEQRSRWAGRYNLSVLDEAIKKTAPRFGCISSPDVALKYPEVKHRSAADSIIHAIGLETLGFPAIRDSKQDFALRYGLPPLINAEAEPGKHKDNDKDTSSDVKDFDSGKDADGSNQPDSKQREDNSDKKNDASAPPKEKGDGRTKATPINDVRTVRKLLRALTLKGSNRSKLVTLRDEALNLDLEKNPIAFCFILRSMFEISAKVFCEDHKGQPQAPTSTTIKGGDRFLAEILKDIVSYLNQNKNDQAMTRLLHGAGTEIARPEGILSITSMNQLVHSTTFTIRASDIPSLFVNIYPLLDNMNK